MGGPVARPFEPGRQGAALVLERRHSRGRCQKTPLLCEYWPLMKAAREGQQHGETTTALLNSVPRRAKKLDRVRHRLAFIAASV